METTEKEYVMDFTIETSEARNEHVKKILANTPSEKLSPYYLEQLTKYILCLDTKKERKRSDQIITDNRRKRMDEREISFEGLVGKLENGEDGIYSMIANDKNIIFQHKTSITQEDLDTIPPLRELHEQILKVEKMKKEATGRRKKLLSDQLVQMRKDQYVIKGAYKKPIYSMNLVRSFSKIDLGEEITIGDDKLPHSTGLVNFFNEAHVSAILCNYSKIKEDSYEKLHEDAKWMLLDFEALADAALKDPYPMLYDLMIYKIDGRTNAEIQDLLYENHGVKHTVEYISSLWRKKIPKLIVEEAQKEYLIWHYTNKEKGYWKKCNRCGQIKLGHPFFFSKNSTSKDGLYSICKACRNKKK